MDDKVLYQEFLNGDKEALEKIIGKYRNNMLFFISRYTKNAEVSEDIFQDVVLYVLEKKENYNSKYSLKTYLYTIAKSKAINYINKEKKTTNLDDVQDTYADTKLLEEILFTKERQKKIKQVMDKLKTDYQLVLYLTLIEKLSYKETAYIMGKTPSQIKALAHNAKKKMKEELKEEGVVEMRNYKLTRVLLTVAITIIGLTGLTYGAVKIYEKYQNAKLQPSFTGSVGNADENNVWVGTFQLVWNDFMDFLGENKIEFEGGTPELAKELNKRSFTKNELSEKDYYSVVGPVTDSLKSKIESDLKERFNETSDILDRVDWKKTEDHYLLYAMLKKEFTFKTPFPELGSKTFGNSKKLVKYFGLECSTIDETFENVEVLFYNSQDDFAVKINTKEGEELLLYRTKETKSFEELYNEMIEKSKTYTGKKNLIRDKDELLVPFIKVKADINYDELCGKYVKERDAYIEQAVQTVDFELDNYGGHIKSDAMINMYCSVSDKEPRKFYFTDTFVLFMREEGKDKPYFALRVADTDVLVEPEIN